MKKFTLLFITTTLFVWGNTHFTANFQESFFKDVNEKNIYKRHYFDFLTTTCEEDEVCINETILRLKDWKSVQQNHFFQKEKQKYYQSVTLSLDELNNIKTYLFEIISSKDITNSEFLTFLDLSQQRLSIFFYDALEQSLYLIGSDLISSGNMEKEKNISVGDDHYLKTPQGVFENLQGWRSKGQYNEDKVVMPYGQKGRFVYYFGRQKSIRYKVFDENKNKIDNLQKASIISDYLQFALHAHESSLSLGVPNSHGCIRISNELNIFLDEFLVLHQNNIHQGQWRNPTAKKPNHFPKTSWSGKYLIIVDDI